LRRIKLNVIPKEMLVRTFFAALMLVRATYAGVWSAQESYDHQTWRTENGLPQNSVHSIVQTSDGYIWLATEGGLARFDGLKFVVFDSENTPGLRSTNIRSLLEDGDQSLWIGTADGLTRLNGGKFTAFTTAQGLPSNNILSLSRNAGGAVEVMTSEGRVVRRDGQFVRESAEPLEAGATVLTHWLRGRRITASMHDSSGALWVGTETGAVRILGDQVYPIQSPDVIAHGLILSIFQDREGDIWIGTDSDGVTVLRDQRFKAFGRDAGIPDALVRCVFEDSGGTIWAGTNGQGLRRFDGRTFASFTTADGLSSDVIFAVADDGHGDLFVGTPDGLNILHERHVRWLTSADGLPDDFVRSIYRDSDDTIWIGTRRGLAHYVSGRVTTYSVSDGLPSDLVGATLRGKNGCLWVGTLKGLACLKDGRVTRPVSLAAIGETAITSLFEDAGGSLWIGTAGRGLVRLAGQRAFEFPPALGMPGDISGLIDDAHGYLWMASPRGLFRASAAGLESYAEGRVQTVSVAAYSTSDSLPVSDFSTGGHPSAWRDRRNTIWFASAKGLVTIDDRHTQSNRVPPGVVVERLTADDRVVDPFETSSLGPGISRISFEYSGLSFRAPQQIRFKYKLEGFDNRWIEAGTRRAAYYTNLPPGAYRFRVLARNNDGLWNVQSADVSFHLRPHYYQTNWFRALLLLMIAACAYAIYRRRVQHVRTELNAVMAERNRIAREIHDTLAQGFVGVSVQLELVRRLMSTSAESAGEVLRQAQDLVQDSLAEARRSIWNLRSQTGSDDDLRSKLSKAVRQSVQNRDLDVRIEVSGAYRPLPARIETEVLRIGREAVMNAVRHADATRLDVSLAFDSNKAQMTICDDGKGFTPGEEGDRSEGHFGLRGMRERAEAIDASLNVSTAAGKGTQVCLEFPLK
jgi:signal transduction histidine kinase/ligand-binding sensor domain-containing protein